MLTVLPLDTLQTQSQLVAKPTALQKFFNQVICYNKPLYTLMTRKQSGLQSLSGIYG